MVPADQLKPDVDDADFVHTGPATLAGRYMRRFWQPVYVSERLKAAQAAPIRIMSEEFTLYRGASGATYVVGFRCAHRGTQLSLGWVEGDCIRCFYHGWKYDGTGNALSNRRRMRLCIKSKNPELSNARIFGACVRLPG
jgi:5,5'-dehydrodivanillate O-demethylase